MTYSGIIDFLTQIISAEILIFGTVYISYSISKLLIKKSSPPLLWCSIITIGLWISTIGFHLLIWCELFKLQVAVLIMCILISIIRLTLRISFTTFCSFFLYNYFWLKKIFKVRRNNKLNLYYNFISFFIIIAILRTLILVPLGWDFLTYHGPKAAMWVQSGSLKLMNAPGGWSYYRHFFGGGEIFIAWAMLIFNNDLIVNFVDSIEWIFLGLAIYCLAREIGLKARYSWIAALYVLFIPAIYRAVGSGYVELVLNLSIVLGTLFIIKWIKTNEIKYFLLSAMAYGVAGGIKITALPIIIILLVISIFYLLTRRVELKVWKYWLLGCFILGFTILPWFIRNIIETGFPLDMPLQFAGIHFGQNNKALALYQIRDNLKPYNFHTEFNVLKSIFQMPWITYTHLSFLTIVPLFIGLIGLVLYFNKNRFIFLITIGIILSTIISFYFPNFSVTRILWATTSGRFLYPLVIPLIIFSFTFFNESPLTQKLYSYILSLFIVIHLIFNAFYGWGSFEYYYIFIFLSLVIFSIVILNISIKHFKSTGTIIFILIFPIILLFSLDYVKRDLRYRTIFETVVFHDIPKYWLGAALLLENNQDSCKIAVTSGLNQNFDGWFIYYFLGKKFQNEIVYVTTKNSNNRNYELMDPREIKYSFDDWLSNLEKEKITHVISFFPPSIELQWMKNRPDLFIQEFPNEKNNFWGLYKLKY